MQRSFLSPTELQQFEGVSGLADEGRSLVPWGSVVGELLLEPRGDLSRTPGLEPPTLIHDPSGMTSRRQRRLTDGLGEKSFDLGGEIDQLAAASEAT